MKPLLLSLLLALPAFAQKDTYPVPPEAKRQDGVPQGEIHPFVFKNSKIFPGTERDYWVYVPAQYDAKKPACVMVFQDGQADVNPDRGSRSPVVFDNLIHAGDMPVTVAVYVNPGVVPAASDQALPRYNRSFEYDGMGDRYARFLIDELLPTVGKKWKLSDDPNDRCIAGASSGAICAFTAAWERPDAFRRVYSTIGTYVGLRGGDEYPTLVRKTEPKPLRIFMQDGSNDLNIYAGDWWMANQTMLRALQWSGYEVEYRWGEGGHNRKQGAALLPEALRWIWKDWPKPVQTHLDASKHRLKEFLVPGEDWKRVGEGYEFTEGGAANAKGEVFFSDIPNSRIHKIGLDGKVGVFAENTGKANGLMFGPDGRLYACAGGKMRITAYAADGSAEDVAEGIGGNDLCIRHDGAIYVSEPRNRKVWMIPKGGKARVVDEDHPGCNGILLSPDQSLLYVTDFAGRMITSYQVAEDGSLKHKQPYYHLHLPPRESRGRLDGMTVDDEGWLYVATGLGVQICDQAGRVNAILPPPAGARHPANVCFGGKDLDALFIMCGDKVYQRKLKKKGVLSWQPPVKPVKPRL